MRCQQTTRSQVRSAERRLWHAVCSQRGHEAVDLPRRSCPAQPHRAHRLLRHVPRQLLRRLRGSLPHLLRDESSRGRGPLARSCPRRACGRARFLRLPSFRFPCIPSRRIPLRASGSLPVGEREPSFALVVAPLEQQDALFQVPREKVSIFSENQARMLAACCRALLRAPLHSRRKSATLESNSRASRTSSSNCC